MKNISRTLQFVIFFGIVLGIYSLVNFYIYSRGYQSISGLPQIRPLFTIGFVALAASYILGTILLRIRESDFARMLVHMGAFWLGAMLYITLLILAVDLIYLLLMAGHYITGGRLPYGPWDQPYLFFSILLVTLFLLIYGYFNARRLWVRSHIVQIAKSPPIPKNWKIAVVSDLHLGSIHGEKFLHRIVSAINALEPDLVLVAGDVFDDNVKTVVSRDLGRQFRDISAPYGLYAITGNHEHISGAEPAVAYLEDCGMRFLRDEWILLDDSLVIAGREDRDSPRFSGKPRMPLNLLLRDIPPGYPVVLLDHQPFNLQAKAAAGVDVSFSGHTHHGQLWPICLITNAIFELSHGYTQIGESHFIVSSGAGTWGPPVRIGTSAEVIFAELKFQGF
jgi:hypothetical protein